MTADENGVDEFDFGFTGDPPSQEEIDLDHKVGFIGDLLCQAARGDSTAWALSTAFASVAARTARPITDRQASQLKAAAELAWKGAHHHLPPHYRRTAIDTGMRALAFQIDRWRLTRAELRLLPHPDTSDAQAYARLFRNDCHNIALCEEITDRARRRSEDRTARNAALIGEILHEAVNGVATSRSRGWN